MLERKIRERGETLTEFLDYASRFARRTGESGTLSERNLKRLISGRKSDGSPIGLPRPATARLLERIFDLPIEQLLSPPDETQLPHAGTEDELRHRLRSSSRVDPQVIAILKRQLDEIRRLDRQLGVIVVRDEVSIKVGQVARLLTHSLSPRTRQQLAGLLAELCTLLGWQTLDAGNPDQAWRHYEQAKTAALESNDPQRLAHASAEQAFALLDIGETEAAVEALTAARRTAEHSASRHLRAWLAAAHGEALAHGSDRSRALRAFDQAATLLPPSDNEPAEPYLALNEIHLTRWRGHALAQMGEPEAVAVLTSALDGLDPAFTRAEASLRVDLVIALLKQEEREEAAQHLETAAAMAESVGSRRQVRRIRKVQLPHAPHHTPATL
ncbi:MULTISPECIES: hypothetical protein [Amycolatopsis]|uniref:hypothetical protein n=1 Tax=Amycolatopsis TaxID=1813 RepID=UPI000B8AE23F|nr:MULTISPECIES: hypothetical protein [Amycolatopsis]OXM71913.1 hypothetical protein CF166_17575 [Amycolatopsis sp. KNN50.9b]